MLNTLKLFIPALLPSWRFFDFIAPSPRIQFALLNDKATTEWHEFRPRPATLSFLQMLGRMLWNPSWNESLFMISCAERLIAQPTQHSEDEILKRIMLELQRDTFKASLKTATHLQFRLLEVQRHGSQLQQQTVFHSRLQPLSSDDPQ